MRDARQGITAHWGISTINPAGEAIPTTCQTPARVSQHIGERAHPLAFAGGCGGALYANQLGR